MERLEISSRKLEIPRESFMHHSFLVPYFCVFLPLLFNFLCFCQVLAISAPYCAHLCMKCSVGISNFLNRSLVFPILLISSISLHWSLRKAFLSLLAFLWNSAFRWVYLSFSPLPLASLLFSAICKASSENHFALFHFIFLGMVLIPASCSVPRTSIQCSSVTLSIISSPLNLFLTSTVQSYGL